MPKIGDVGEPCVVCGSTTVYLNENHSMCKNFGCPLWYIPSQWVTTKDGDDGDGFVDVYVGKKKLASYRDEPLEGFEERGFVRNIIKHKPDF